MKTVSSVLSSVGRGFGEVGACKKKEGVANLDDRLFLAHDGWAGWPSGEVGWRGAQGACVMRR